MGRHAAGVVLVLMIGASPVFGQDAMFVVTTRSADVHKAPSTGSAVIAKVRLGQTFVVARELGSWVSIPWPDAEDGFAYLHVAWGRISRGAGVEPRPITVAESAAVPANRLTVSTPAAQVAQVPPNSTIARPQMSRPPRPAISLPSHVIGFGGRLETTTFGFAAAARAWSYGPLGVQVEAGRSMYTSVAGRERLRSMQFAPSLIYSLPNLVTNAIWARPYVGAGMRFHRSALRSEPDAVDHGFEPQVFGGAEFTWANVPQFALSAELRQQWAPPTFDGFDLGGLGVSLSGHWYVK